MTAVLVLYVYKLEKSNREQARAHEEEKVYGPGRRRRRVSTTCRVLFGKARSCTVLYRRRTPTRAVHLGLRARELYISQRTATAFLDRHLPKRVH